ncbi:polyhydroxyalkanoate synthesis regulator DNA-binding domain-containing protein [Desulfosarcina sp.]|uniref:polyhydroxyalkanoate synthesis regulator DNA-binding domain-containing protein n=1 Tax=Desulfosarcina sp. TaxID=2027861 RepID=UPI003568ABE7
MRTIKTYANGRFYDLLNKRYMSKDQLVALIDKKEAIKIIMHNTGSDVTQSVVKKMSTVVKPKKESALHIDGLRKWVSDQVDRQIEKAIQLINLPTKGQINRLTADIEKLTQQVDGLQHRLVDTKPPVAAPPTVPVETVSEQA